MAPSKDHTNAELANRLIDHADAIENPGAHEAEQDIRLAAARLKELDDPTPLVPRLVAELTKVATFSTDPETRTVLRGLLGSGVLGSSLPEAR
jgi:hypothetical protein